jgi:hypothetical protein
MDTIKDVSNNSEILKEEIRKDTSELREKIHKLLDKHQGKSRSDKRLNKIYRLILGKAEELGKSRFFDNPDFYAKIEAFMTYKSKQDINGDTVIATDIDDLIGEVFKSLYINFLLNYLEGESCIPFPYFGEMYIKEVTRLDESYSEKTKFFYGKMKLDKDLREDLHSIDNDEKLPIIESILEDTKKILMDKLQ